MNTGNRPQETTESQTQDSQLYRSLARYYATQVRKQETRKKRIHSLACALVTAFFLGLIAFSYLSRL